MQVVELGFRARGNSSRDFLAGGTLQKVVNESLVGFRLLRGQTAELGKKTRGDADGDQLLSIAGYGASHSAGAAQLLVGRLGNIGKI